MKKFGYAIDGDEFVVEHEGKLGHGKITWSTTGAEQVLVGQRAAASYLMPTEDLKKVSPYISEWDRNGLIQGTSENGKNIRYTAKELDRFAASPKGQELIAKVRNRTQKNKA